MGREAPTGNRRQASKWIRQWGDWSRVFFIYGVFFSKGTMHINHVNVPDLAMRAGFHQQSLAV